MFKARGNNSAGINSWEDFKKLDDAELAQSGDHKQQVAECLYLADVIIENNGTIDELKQKIENFISSESSFRG